MRNDALRQTSDTPAWSMADYAVLVVATLLAAALRWLKLDVVPPGFYHDEAISGLAGLDVLRGHLVVLYGFDAREPAFHWLVAFWQLLLGPTVLAVRSAAAFSGTLTVPALYVLSRRMFGRFVAACAAFGLALSFWHLELSRFGVAGVTVPLFLTVSCYLLWRGISAKPARGRAFLLAGVSFGLTGYTYLAARAVPLLLGSFVLWQGLIDRPTLRRLVRPYVLATLVAAAVLAPLVYTLLTQPDLFAARSGRVSLLGQPDAPTAIAQSALRTLGMFVVAGDPNLRHNIDAQPVFDPVSAALFVLGLLVALRRWRQPAYAFCVLWLLVMLLPGMLSIDNPHFIRTLGAAPAAYILFGVGIASLGSWLSPRLSSRAYGCIIVAGFLALTLFTYQRYFQVWAKEPAVAQAFETMLSEPARFLASAPAAPEIVLVGDAYAKEYPQVFAYLAGRATRQVTWYDDNTSLLLPGASEPQIAPAGTVFLVLGDNPIARNLLGRSPSIESLGSMGVAGTSMAAAFRALAPVQPWRMDPTGQLGLTVGSALRLESYRLTVGDEAGPSDSRWQAAVLPGHELEIQTQWSPLHAEERQDLRLSFQLVDAAGQRWAGQDVSGYPMDQWRGGERVLTVTEIAVPENTPPGRYELRIGAYWYGTQGRLPVIDEGGRAIGDSARMAVVKVLPALSYDAPEHTVWQDLAGGPVLLGYNLKLVEKELRVILFWQAAQQMSDDDVVFVHVEGQDGNLVAQNDSPPAGGRFPTSFWSAGDVIQDEHVIPLGATLGPGTYRLKVGMYSRDTGRRLLTGGGDAIALGVIAVP